MTIIKAYTDLKQSEDLMKYLPISSADMYYEFDWDLDFNTRYKSIPIVIEKSNHFELYSQDIPCWSLAALYNILPNNEHIATSVSRGGWQIQPINYLPNAWWCEYEDSENLTEFNVSAENPIDACYEMICKLHERKLI